MGRWSIKAQNVNALLRKLVDTVTGEHTDTMSDVTFGMQKVLDELQSMGGKPLKRWT